jgi:hypothetical protein
VAAVRDDRLEALDEEDDVDRIALRGVDRDRPRRRSAPALPRIIACCDDLDGR